LRVPAILDGKRAEAGVDPRNLLAHEAFSTCGGRQLEQFPVLKAVPHLLEPIAQHRSVQGDAGRRTQPDGGAVVVARVEQEPVSVPGPGIAEGVDI
jgi:hypothetical protein